MYRLTTLLVGIFAFPSGLRAVAQVHGGQLAFTTAYDDAKSSVDSLACSTILKKRHDSTLGSIPNSPMIGALDKVSVDGASGCLECYNVTYAGTSAAILAVDSASGGWVVSLAAMNALTNNQASLGVVEVTYHKIEADSCKLG